MRPRRGDIRLHGQSILGIEPHALLSRRVWFLPQDSSLFSYLSVKDNLPIVLHQLGLARDEAETRIAACFEGLPDLQISRRKNAGDLSGGQRKMLECAKVAVVRPELLFVDEPSVGLAPKVALQVYEQITSFREGGMTIFLIDHNVRKVIELADYVYVLNMGRIVNEGPREAFAGELKGQVQRWLGL